MVKQAKEVLEWYDNMKNPVPTWYKESKYYKKLEFNMIKNEEVIPWYICQTE